MVGRFMMAVVLATAGIISGIVALVEWESIHRNSPMRSAAELVASPPEGFDEITLPAHTAHFEKAQFFGFDGGLGKILFVVYPAVQDRATILVRTKRFKSRNDVPKSKEQAEPIMLRVGPPGTYREERDAVASSLSVPAHTLLVGDERFRGTMSQFGLAFGLAGLLLAAGIWFFAGYLKTAKENAAKRV